MTAEEVEQQARNGWNAMGEEHPSISHVKSMCWQYYLKAWQDACKVLYTEEDMWKVWYNRVVGARGTIDKKELKAAKANFRDWLVLFNDMQKTFKQSKQQ